MVFSKILGLDWQDIVIRATKTFFQAAIAVILISDQPANREVLIAAAAAGASAVWNLVRELWAARK